MDFWCSLGVEIVGGLVTAAALAVLATVIAARRDIDRHDDVLTHLDEDTRRWFRDRDSQLHGDIAVATGNLNAQGLLYSGQWLRAVAALRRQALHEYRDDISAKRRRYAALALAEGPAHALLRRRRKQALRRFELPGAAHETLASWRSDVAPSHMTDTMAVEDPTSHDRESDLRRFEAEGDPAPRP